MDDEETMMNCGAAMEEELPTLRRTSSSPRIRRHPSLMSSASASSIESASFSMFSGGSMTSKWTPPSTPDRSELRAEYHVSMKSLFSPGYILIYMVSFRHAYVDYFFAI